MKNYTQLKKLFGELLKVLPDVVQTKIKNINKERGGDGIYTKRNSPCGRVIVEEVSFIKCYNSNLKVMGKKFPQGFRILITPEVYFTSKKYKGKEDFIIVLYRSHEQYRKYPFDKSNLTVKKGNEIEGFINVDIRDMNSSISGKSLFEGAKSIGRSDMEYASKEEVFKIQLCNLYSIIKIKNFQLENKTELVNSFRDLFEETELYSENPLLIKFTKSGTRCPDTGIHLDYNDLLNGIVRSDEGRDKWFITITKINLHHIIKKTPGQQNHNHKNVFFGTNKGNMLDITLPKSEESLNIMMYRMCWQYSEEEILEEMKKVLEDKKSW
jgi:hypothetical protein